METGKNGYALPFEVISVLLLAAMIGAIVIAKRKVKIDNKLYKDNLRHDHKVFPLTHFLIVSTLMFFIGIYGFLTRRNLITMLMSIELILNSVNINFVVFNRYLISRSAAGTFFCSLYYCHCRC